MLQALNWSYHINDVIVSANKYLGFLKRNIPCEPRPTKLHANKALLLPKLECASIFQNPDQAYLITQVESLQNRAALFICHEYTPLSSIASLNTSLCVTTLQSRRQVSRLCFFHELYNSHHSS